MRVILDTGPLFDLLLYRFWSEHGYLIDENRLTCCKHNIRVDQLSRFLGACRHIILTPGVFVEIAGLARREMQYAKGRPSEMSLAPFWRVTIRELEMMPVEERWTSFLDLDRKFLEELGPTDAALIKCAQEASQERIPILTHDGRLWGRCRSERVPCMHTVEILDLLRR